MSLESAIDNLSSVVARNASNSAVAEIIRQRDAWQAESEKQRARAETYERWHRERGVENARLGRVISSLRGVITRMKKRSVA